MDAAMQDKGCCRLMNLPTKTLLLLLMLLLLMLATSPSEGVQETTEPRITEHPEDQFVVRNEAAMINCKAEGQPLPVISWYRNGQPVVTTNDNPSSHRMLLPSGQLFFLRVVANGGTKGAANRSSSDAGLYYCNATNPVTGRSVLSRNATIAIAMIRDEFREQPPPSSRAATGDSVVLPCRGPRGDPEPQIKWKKDGEPVAPFTAADSRVYVEHGNLHLNDLRKSDAGLYTCVAYNPGGHRDSKPAELTILDKPKIMEVPAEVFPQEDSDVLLPCRATGDVELVATWKRRKGILPAHRSRVLDDRTLRIKKVKVQDEGIYVCRVENSVGWQEAEIRLNVRSQPTFVTTPNNKWVGVGRRVSFECEAIGNPVPAIFWKRENSQSLMFPGESYDRHSIKQDATMVIEGVQKTDAGVYVCQAQSIAGTAIAKARLDVKDVDSRPPPIIFHGPQNQTLPINSLATLQCSASGDPPPAVRWFKSNRILSLSEPRFVLLDSGTLQIHELRRTDTGWYTCKAISETGETAWSGSLSVEAPTDPSIIFRRTPDPSTYPGPPSRPLVSEVRETSVRLAWKPNPNNGASPVSAFTVEYFSHETGEGWTVDSDDIREPSYVVRGLRPDTVYRFLVRSQNSQGLSLPSPVTNPIRTKVGFGKTASQSSWQSGAPVVLSPDQNSVIFLSKQSINQLNGGGGAGGGGATVVHLGPPEAIGSTSMQLRWDVRKNPRAIEGFHIHYCAISRSDGDREEMDPDSNCDIHSFPPAIQTVQNGDARTHVLNHLEENTWYRMSLRPYYLLTEGAESNHVFAKTHEDVPSAAPTEIKAGMSENNTLHVTWQPPPKQHQNGLLTGYKIFLSTNDTQLWHDIWTNVSAGEAYVYSLSKDVAYHIQIAAYSSAGEGVRSDPLLVEYRASREKQHQQPDQVTNEFHPWLMVTVIACLGSALWVTMCTLAVWLCRQRHRRRRRRRHKGGREEEEEAKCGGRQILKASMTSPVGGGRDDTRGMLDNTYENVASIKAAASAATVAVTPLCSQHGGLDRVAIGGGAGCDGSRGAGPSSFSAAAVCDVDYSPAYQPGLPINYPSSSGFSSGHHLLDPFYEAYIIKPKPVYACTSNPSDNPDTYAGQLTSGYYDTSAPNSPEYRGQAVYPIEAPNFPQGYCTLGRTRSREQQKMPFVSEAGDSLVDYSDQVSQRQALVPSTVVCPIKKSYHQQQPYQSTTDSSVAHRTQMRPPSVGSPSAAAAGDAVASYYLDPFSLPTYNDDPKCLAYQFLHYQFPSHTIQPRTNMELRYANSSPHATSEPEQLPTYAGDEVLPRETVVRYFSETDGLLDNSRKHQYPPSPAPMEHLISVDSPMPQERPLLEGNRTETSFHGTLQSDDILLNNRRNLQPNQTACAK